MKAIVDLYQGDCLEVMKSASDNSIDAVVTDPPYGLSFMGKKWDYDVPSVEIWREVLRVLKPGGHLLAFGGTRTYHRLAVNIEDAGFEIRDQIQWLYGQGFPKSLDISKAIDKSVGAEREVIGINPSSRPNSKVVGNKGFDAGLGDGESAGIQSITAPSTDAAKQWSGWGTALKPANEPIVLARKPLEKGLTVAANVQKWGVGGINVDGCRIGFSSEVDKESAKPGTTPKTVNGNENTHGHVVRAEFIQSQGRFPANVILDEEAGRVLDEQSGVSPSNARKNKGEFAGYGSKALNNRPEYKFEDKPGGASRFFYCAKASTSERNQGLEGFEEQIVNDGRQTSIDNAFQRGDTLRKNTHPTVKPVKLMEYLCRLITPPGGTVLDPFMGSGTTGIAAQNEGFSFIGIEMNEDYYKIADTRIKAASKPIERPLPNEGTAVVCETSAKAG